MADLGGGSGLAATSMAAPRPPVAPADATSPSRIRSPRIIMQERAAREARRKAEEEERAAEESQILAEARQREAERRAGVAVGQDPAASRRQQVPEPQPAPTQRIPTSHSQPISSTTTAQQRVGQNQTTQQTPSQAYLGQGSAAQRRSQERPAAPAAAPTTTEPTKPRNSFPHAFERWETLSAHWEGLTSYWIRKLEQNKDDINRDPMNQQLARQVTDLSAAGANLFHAVVELQRLRASSERKFQRWFFETRTELERAQEVKATLEAQLAKELKEREDAIREALESDRGVSKTQKQLAEMRKELAISKEEARRAWEELGRREQEERDRTLSLQSGHPTLVGGVQVVPMVQTSHTRQGSSRDHGSSYQQEYGYAHGTEPEASRTPTGHRTPENRHYTQSSRHADESGVSPPSAAATSEGHYGEVVYIRDAEGNYVVDTHGNRIPYQTAGSSSSTSDRGEYDTPATTNPPASGHEAVSGSSPGSQWPSAGASYTSATPTAPAPAPAPQPPVAGEQDYSGEGYGAPSWDRHHHPSRLSDVMEEDDERSRTSASHLSRGA